MAKGSRDRGDHSIDHDRQWIRLQLFGTKQSVSLMIDRLHSAGVMDRVYWSQPMPVPGVVGEWVSVLRRSW
ncbi:MAG: hypothetical protein B0A82_15220 [Alkalinema sp. CACIAM 70d]|nr:MAG: hypothetical protein B0A82_15220 [Alkalinema sp. CACIAM 70d]